MQYLSYYRNFFLPLAASLSDDDFLSFVRQTAENLKAAHPAEAALLEPLYTAQRAARQAAGTGGKSSTSLTLGQTIRGFYQWVRLTNATTVFAKYPLPTMVERVTILPKGASGIYDADHAELLAEATTYVNGLKTYKAVLGDTAGQEGDQWLAKLNQALGGRGLEVSGRQSASSALDEAEGATCVVLFRVYGRLIDAYAEQPEQAYALFPFPESDRPADPAPGPGGSPI